MTQKKGKQSNRNLAATRHDEIFTKIITKNHKRLFISCIPIYLLANVAAVGLLITGRASKHLTWETIILEFAIVIPVLTLSYVIVKRMKGRPSSAYVAITGTTLFFFVFQYFIYGTPELFATHYLILVFSVLYFNERVALYAFLLVVLSQTSLFVLRPELRPDLVPGAHTSALVVRMIIYLFAGIGATVGSKASRELLMLAIEKADESEKNLTGLRQVVGAVAKSVKVLKSQVESQDNVVTEINDLSQKQSASLEEVSSTLEELSGNSESITKTAKSLFEEMGIANDSVEDLRKVYDVILNSASSINTSISEVTKYSKQTFEQIKIIMEKFQILGDKGTDISNFIQVINDIADKVNLLSLNASIEAARAGEYGRGFSVVAEEISKLADATSKNASEIEKLINENKLLLEGSREFVEEFSRMVIQLNNAIGSITKEIGSVGDLIVDIGNTVKIINSMGTKIYDSSKNIETSTNEQQVATEESSRSVQYVYEASEQLVAVATNITYSTKTINRLADDLIALVQTIHFEEAAASESAETGSAA